MSDKKGAFDAALKTLRLKSDNKFAYAVYILNLEGQKDAASLLEVVGKILGQPRENVKQRLILGLDCFTDIKDDEKSENGWWKRQIRALLESLPDKEKE